MVRKFLPSEVSSHSLLGTMSSSVLNSSSVLIFEEVNSIINELIHTTTHTCNSTTTSSQASSYVEATLRVSVHKPLP